MMIVSETNFLITPTSIEEIQENQEENGLNWHLGYLDRLMMNYCGINDHDCCYFVTPYDMMIVLTQFDALENKTVWRLIVLTFDSCEIR